MERVSYGQSAVYQSCLPPPPPRGIVSLCNVHIYIYIMCVCVCICIYNFFLLEPSLTWFALHNQLLSRLGLLLSADLCCEGIYIIGRLCWAIVTCRGQDYYKNNLLLG